MKKMISNAKYYLATATLAVMNVAYSFAQSSKAGTALDAATNEVKGAFVSASKLTLAIGAVVGLIGGIICYSNGKSPSACVL